MAGDMVLVRAGVVDQTTVAAAAVSSPTQGLALADRLYLVAEARYVTEQMVKRSA